MDARVRPVKDDAIQALRSLVRAEYAHQHSQQQQQHAMQHTISQKIDESLAANAWQGREPPSDATLSLLLPLLILLSSLLFLLLIFLLFLIVSRKRGGPGGIQLSVEDGPTDFGRDDEFDGEGGVDGVEQRWLDTVDEATKTGYIRAKAWQTQFPPNSQPTDITLTQFLSIQEKGVSAWAFEPDYDSISPPFVIHGRTEITFLADGIGMSRAEGGGACVQCNLPLPKLNEVYYWEAKLHEKPDTTQIAIGLATKPYPAFRLPGWNKFSVGYFSEDGFKSHNYPFAASSYGPPLLEGDVIGLGYRPRTGTVFFTRNGKKLEDAYIGLNQHNLFPTVGSDGQAVIHVNLGQAGFVFIEANVKKWGLAPSQGTLAPPPAYGSERGSILLETATRMGLPDSGNGDRNQRHSHRSNHQGLMRTEGLPAASEEHGLHDVAEEPDEEDVPSDQDEDEVSDENDDREGQGGRLIRPPSPVDSIRMAPHNPPTPNLLDISLHSLHSFSPLQRRLALEAEAAQDTEDSSSSDLENARRRRRRREQRAGDSSSARSVQPPAYHVIDPNTYAPGVAEAMLGESFAAFQAAQAGNWAALSQSLPSNSVYEGRTAADPADRPETSRRLMERLMAWTRNAQNQQTPTAES